MRCHKFKYTTREGSWGHEPFLWGHEPIRQGNKPLLLGTNEFCYRHTLNQKRMSSCLHKHPIYKLFSIT